MRQFFLSSLLILITFGLSVNDATARGFGGGRGFGMMRSKSVFTHSPRAQKASPSSSARSGNSGRLRGALTGLLLGSLLTSMFLGHGFGGALLSWLIVGMIVYFIISFLRRRKQNNLR